METQILAPTPGQDYPRTWNEFLDWFATEEACLTFLEKLRWPHGFICPRCGNTGDVYRASRTRLMCRACQYQGTVTSGTIFDKTRTPLRVWLAPVSGMQGATQCGGVPGVHPTIVAITASSLIRTGG